MDLCCQRSRNCQNRIEEVTVIEAGKKAPGFSLKDQFQREVSLSQFNGRRHVLLLFYPLDYTPT
jgi:peroxiredoxin